MENEWLDLAYINFDKVILHGQINNGIIDAFGVGNSQSVEQVLTQEQRREVEDLSFKHEREMRKLLRSFVND